MAKTKKYGISFPITVKSDEKTLFDTNSTLAEAVRSQIMHVIFTPKGEKLRDPEFGTHLIQYIFNPNDNQTWGDIREEIDVAIGKYVPECHIKDIDIAAGEDGRDLYARILYTISSNGGIMTYETITKL